MSKVGLDTNVVVRYLLGDDKKQSAVATRVVDQLCSENNPGYITLAVFFEVCSVLLESKKIQIDRIRFITAIEKLLGYNHLEFENINVIRQALHEMGIVNIDISDILIGFSNMEKGCATTLTFDRKAFKRLEEFTDITAYAR